jgi:hypothetical protein
MAEAANRRVRPWFFARPANRRVRPWFFARRDAARYADMRSISRRGRGTWVISRSPTTIVP